MIDYNKDIVSFYKIFKVGNLIYYCKNIDHIYLILGMELNETELNLRLYDMKRNKLITKYSIHESEKYLLSKFELFEINQ